MKTIATATYIDKSDMRPGPWLNEPDEVLWTDPDTGLSCLALRSPDASDWCGYVGVSKDHSYYKLDRDCVSGIDVHGGLTYGDFVEESLIQVPVPNGLWWFGFDCGHYRDLSPGWLHNRNAPPPPFEVYRDLEFVKDQCAKVASQLHQIQEQKEPK